MGCGSSVQVQPDIAALDTVESVEHALAAADIEREDIETRIATLKTIKTRLTVHVPEDASSTPPDVVGSVYGCIQNDAPQADVPEDASSTPPHVVGSESDCIQNDTPQADLPEDASNPPSQLVGSESELSQAAAPPPKEDEPAPMSEIDQYIFLAAEQVISDINDKEEYSGTNKEGLNKDGFKALVRETLGDGADEFGADEYEEMWTTLEANGDGIIDVAELSAYMKQLTG